MKKEASLSRLNEHLQNTAEYDEAYQKAIEMARKSLNSIKSLQGEKKKEKETT
jgi:ribosomal protein S5